MHYFIKILSRTKFLSTKMAALNIGNKIIKGTSSKKFLEKMLDENLSLKDHIKTDENKLAKNVDLYIARNNSMMKLL